MLIYIARRLVWTVAVVAVVILVTFLVFFKLPAGDPAVRFAGKSPSPDQIELIRHRMGFDQPILDAVRALRLELRQPATSTGGPASATTG